MPNMALFPDRATTVPALMGVVDGFPDTVRRFLLTGIVRKAVNLPQTRHLRRLPALRKGHVSP